MTRWPQPRKCVECGAEFDAIHGSHRYCRDACRKKKYYPSETRVGFKRRLLQEGRWRNFVARRYELRKNMGVKEANEQARKEFGPEKGYVPEKFPQQNPEDRAPPFMLDEATESPDHMKAIEWVAANWVVKNPEFKDAPNSVAVGLWTWAKSSATSSDRFWTMAWSKLLPDKRSRDEFGRASRDGENTIGLIESLVEARGGEAT